MTPENKPSQGGNPPNPEDLTEAGRRYLEMLGLGHLVGQEIHAKSGQALMAEEFLEICGEHATPRLEALERMSSDDPRYPRLCEMLRGAVVKEFVDIPATPKEDR